MHGGAPQRLPFGPVADLALEETGRALLNGTWGRDPAYWKRYRGGTAGRLWTSAEGAPFERILAGVSGQFASPMLVGDRLAFLSDHEGTGNVYSCRLDGSGLLRHTDHDGGYARQASTDGTRVIYQCRGELWLLDDLTPDSTPRPLSVSLGSASTALAPRLLSAADHLGDLSCDYTGLASVIEVRGTVHWLTHRDGPARALAVDPEVRARMPRVLGRDGQVVWVSDAGGVDGLVVAAAEGAEPAVGPATEVATDEGAVEAEPAAGPRRLAARELGLVNELAAAPDGSTVAVAARDGRLLVVDIDSGAVRELAQSPDGAMSGLAYSPDSAWLAWSHPGPEPLSRIRLARLADDEIADVTDGRFVDSEPVFTADGKYLAFLSARIFDPVYDAHFFDLSFPFGARPYLVPLAADTPSPFAPLPQGRPVGNGPDRNDPDKNGAAGQARGGEQADRAPGDHDSEHDGQAGDEDDAPAPVQVDVEGLATRVVSLPVAESRYASLRAVTGGFAWLKEPVIGVLGEGAAVPDAKRPRSVLERFDLSRRKTTELISGLDWFEVSGDGEWLVVRDSGELRVVPVTAQGGSGRGRQRPGRPVPGPVHSRSSRPLAARVHRGRPVHAARLLGPGHGRGGLARRAGFLPAGAGPDRHRLGVHRPALGGRRRAGHLPRLHPAPGHPGQRRQGPGGPARRGPVPGARRPLADRPGAARRVLRTRGRGLRWPRRA